MNIRSPMMWSTSSRRSGFIEVTDSKDKQFDESMREGMFGSAAEICFAFLPILVIAFVYIYRQRSFTEFVMSPEISFGATVLYGQSVVRWAESFIFATLNVGKLVKKEFVGLFIALIIVFGLTPGLICLSILITDEKAALWLGIYQLMNLLMSYVIFFFANSSYIILQRMR